VQQTKTLEQARAALDHHDWQAAFEALVSLDEADGLSGSDLARLGEAAWWSAHPDESLDAFERACTAYIGEDDPNGAALMALRLALEHADRLEPALASGWTQRAARLLEGQPESVASGYLEIMRVRQSFEGGSIDDVIEHATMAYEVGARFGERDLQALGLTIQGAALVTAAEIDRGLALMDEGTLAATGGELTPFVAGNVYCLMIGICRSVADYRRAGEWTEAVSRWCDREAITGFPGICRVQRAEILRLRGALAEAEVEARKAVIELTAFGRLPQAGAGAYEVGEVRLRLGDLDGATEAFEQAHGLGHHAQPGLALALLARGEIRSAHASIASALDGIEDPLESAQLLPAKVEIALAASDLAEARAAADDLAAIATSYDTLVFRAKAAHAAGAVLAEEGDPSAGVRELRKAVRWWTEADAPYEAAQARRRLGRALRSAGDDATANLELKAARNTFEQLGAVLDRDQCDALIAAGVDTGGGRRVVRTFMFTDIVGSTDLINTIGDEAWGDVLRSHDETLRSAIASHSGEIVHTTGDGFFASFRDVAAAVDSAVAIQQRLADHRRRHGFAPDVRIGIHSAEATQTADDYAGLGVHEAARVGAIASGGEVLVTLSTLADVSLPFPAVNERGVELKGFGTPVRVVTIDWKA
jgi:class 3 adenylate cyclase